MIELADHVINALIGASVSFLVGCLILGVQVFFYTKNFQDEYGQKIEKIRITINWGLEKALRVLFMNRKYALLDASEEIKWVKVFPETIDDIRFTEGIGTEVFPELTIQELQEEYVELVKLNDMEDIYNEVRKLKKWSTAVKDAKKYLRKLGIFIILFGIIISACLFTIVSFPTDAVLYGMLYILTILGACIFAPIYRMFRGYLDIVHDVDKTYEKIEQGNLEL